MLPNAEAHLAENDRVCIVLKPRLVANCRKILSPEARPPHTKALKGRQRRVVERRRCVALGVAWVGAGGEHQGVVALRGCVRAPVPERFLACCLVTLH